MRPHILATGEFYHIYNRGVDKRKTFIDESDYRVFLHALLAVNTAHQIKSGISLVSVVAYAIMPNHYHLLLRQEVDAGISTLFHSALTKYTMYFNKKYQRDGRLWSAPFRSKHIQGDAYLQQLIRYIHQNPFDLADPRQNLTPEAFLRRYAWSSFHAYVGGFDPLVNGTMPEFFSLEDYQTYPKA